MSLTKVLHYVGIMNMGGQETFIMNLYKQIDRTKIQFDFLTLGMEKGYYDNEIEKLGGKVYSIPYRKKSIIQYIKNIRSIFRNYPIVHIHTASTKVIFDVIIARLVGVKKIIVHSHSISDQDSKLIHLLCKCFLKFTPIMRFACSKEAGEWLFGKKKEVYIVKNGINTSQYRYQSENREKKRKELGILDSDKVIGHIGRFSKEKNHDFILKIFYKIAKDSNTKLLLIGDRRRKKENRK